MSKRHNEKDVASEFDDYDEFGIDGLTYDVSLEDLLSSYENDEDEPWIGRSRDQARDRLKQMRNAPVRHNGFGDDWDDDDDW